MGRPEARSSSISANACRCPSVGSNGSEASQARVSSAGGSSGNARPLVLAALPPRREGDLMEEELFERQAAACLLGVLGAPWEVCGAQRVGGTAKPVLGAKLRRERLDRVAAHPGAAPDPFADTVGAEPVGDRMDGHEPDGVDAALAHAVRPDDLVRRDLERGAVELSREEQARAGPEALQKPRLVEPDRLGRTRRVGDVSLDDPQAPVARRPHARLAHLDQDRRLLADPELADLQDVGAIAIAVRADATEGLRSSPGRFPRREPTASGPRPSGC